MTTKESTNAPDASPSSLEQVRDILFGSELRRTDQRLGKLQDAVRGELDQLRTETAKKLDGMRASLADDHGWRFHWRSSFQIRQ